MENKGDHSQHGPSPSKPSLSTPYLPSWSNTPGHGNMVTGNKRPYLPDVSMVVAGASGQELVVRTDAGLHIEGGVAMATEN